MNLVINAAEAIGERGGTVIATRVREVAASDEALWRASGQPLAPGRYVSLEVATTGPGWTRRRSTASSSRSSRPSSPGAASASPPCSASCAATAAR